MEQTPPSKRDVNPMDAAWASDATQAKKKRKFCDISIDRQVINALRDHASHLKEWQKDGLKVGDLTLRQRVRMAKEKVRNKEADISFGKMYWSKVIAMYSSGDALMDMLKVRRDSDGEADEAVINGYKGLVRHPPNRQLLATWAERTGRVLSVHEVKVLLLSLLKLSPSASVEQTSIGLSLMGCLSRTKASEVAADCMAAMVPRFSEFLTQAWTKTCSSGMLPTEFVCLHAESMKLVFAPADLRVVLNLKADAPLRGVRDVIVRLAGSGPLGEKLFSSAAKQLVAEDVQTLIDGHISTWLAKDSKTTQNLMQAISDCLAACEREDCVKLLTGKRKITLKYRNLEFETTVKSVDQEIDVRFHCCLRAACSAAGLVECLPGEVELCAAPNAQIPKKFDKGLVQSLSAVRRSLNAFVRDEKQEELTAETIQGIIRGNDSALRSLDKKFFIDIAIMEHVTGEKGENRLKDVFMERCVPTESNDVSANAAKQGAEELVASAAFRWTKDAVQGELKAATDMLAKIVSEKPWLPEGETTPWLKRVIAGFPYFLKHEYQTEGPATRNDAGEEVPGRMLTKTLRGSMALSAKLRTFEGNDNPAQAHLKIFSCWRHLLSDGQQAVLSDLALKCAAPLADAVLAPASKKKPEPKAKGRKAKVKRNIEEEVDAAVEAQLYA